ncbi:CidA/LrgA family protein [Paracoccus sp. (in: a-proteobacteria)]|uniref:CidA/LrgA family protein n=1 Tax=Paracoccus sp. TaxID=267 RepID=UPI003A85AF72
MVGPIAILLCCQLAGEVAARLLGLPVPGPVIGLVLLVAVFLVSPAVVGYVGPLSRAILANLSLLFVPAGVGVVGNLNILSANWLAFAVILIVSTVFAMLISVGTFLAVARLTRGRDV